MDSKLARLLKLIAQKSYQFRPDNPFTLASGRKSPYYIDGKATMHDPEGKYLVGEVFFDKIKELNIHAIGGLTMGADPIAIAASLLSYIHGQPIRSFSIRKAPKDHGTGKRIEGQVSPGERVIIVDDVITTGESVLDALHAARDYGLEVVGVIVLVDREEGGLDNIRREQKNAIAIFNMSQIKNYVPAIGERHGETCAGSPEEFTAGMSAAT